jgi:hypothetical protein
MWLIIQVAASMLHAIVRQRVWLYLLEVTAAVKDRLMELPESRVQ